MGYPTPIEWTDATWNPVGGCEIHSPGCTNCYAMPIAASGRLRNHPLYRGITKTVNGKPVFNGVLSSLPHDHNGWMWPLLWRGAAEPILGKDQRSLIFVGDMADLFHRLRKLSDIDYTVATVMLSRHIGQLLTKRADEMAKYFQSPDTARRLYNIMFDLGIKREWKGCDVDRIVSDGAPYLPSTALWLGFSAERQQEMDERSQHLRVLAESGWQIFVSIEPMLGPITLPSWFSRLQRRPWIIVGGESGPAARPMKVDWARGIEHQASLMRCPFFFKQWGEWAPYDRSRFSTGCTDEPIQRFGKKLSGRLLDGVEHNAFPEVA